MRASSYFACVALLFVSLVGSVASAQEAGDTKEDRAKAAERYLKIVPMKGLMSDMAVEMGKNLPASEAAKLKKCLTEDVDIAVLEKATIDSMVNNFTTKEITALADFYASPEGRSVMKKFGRYMAEVMPTIQKEVERALSK